MIVKKLQKITGHVKNITKMGVLNGILKMEKHMLLLTTTITGTSG